MASAAEPRSRKCPKNSAAIASPAPFTCSGSSGVRTRQQLFASDTRTSIASSGVSCTCSEVTSTIPGPRACTASTAACTSASVGVADHRVAAILRRRIGPLHPRDGVEDRGADLGRAHVARQHAVTGAEHAPLLDALHQFADHVGLEYAPAPLAVAGMVGELHGMDCPYLDAEQLQR